METQFGDLDYSYEDLKSRFSNLQSLTDALNRSHIELQYQHFQLEEEHQLLTTKYDSLERENNNLETKHRSLKNSFESLERDYEIEKAMRIGNSLESYYDYLREELGPTGAEWWWLAVRQTRWQIQVGRPLPPSKVLSGLRWTYPPRRLGFTTRSV